MLVVEPHKNELPAFPYFSDPLRNGCIESSRIVCGCCGKERDYVYVGPIYVATEVGSLCPWCIADGQAAVKWAATFNDTCSAPDTVPQDVLDIIQCKTPGYVTWQGNVWLFQGNDAMVFEGEVDGHQLLSEGDASKIVACKLALDEWGLGDLSLDQISPGGQPAIYLFRSPQSSEYQAYADMT